MSLECCWVLFNNAPAASAEAPNLSVGIVLHLMWIGIGRITGLCTIENLPGVYQHAENAVGSMLQLWSSTSYFMAIDVNGRSRGRGDEVLSSPKNAQIMVCLHILQRGISTLLTKSVFYRDSPLHRFVLSSRFSKIEGLKMMTASWSVLAAVFKHLKIQTCF